MNYENHYVKLIQKAKNRTLPEKESYYELHHIIPKCLGGNNTPENIVKLTAREHFVAHWLLFRQNPYNNKLAWAFKMMCKIKNNTQSRYIPSSRAYEEAKQAAALASSDLLKGVPKSEDHKKKSGEGNKGKKRTEETKALLSSLKKGKQSARAKGVFQLNTDGSIVSWFRTTKDAEESTGIVSTSIQSACKGRYKQAGGFLWRYGLEEHSEDIIQNLYKALLMLNLQDLKKVQSFITSLR